VLAAGGRPPAAISSSYVPSHFRARRQSRGRRLAQYSASLTSSLWHRVATPKFCGRLARIRQREQFVQCSCWRTLRSTRKYVHDCLDARIFLRMCFASWMTYTAGIECTRPDSPILCSFGLSLWDIFKFEAVSKILLAQCTSPGQP